MQTMSSDPMNPTTEMSTTVDPIHPFIVRKDKYMWAKRLMGWSALALWFSGCAFNFNLGPRPQILEEAGDDYIYDVNAYDPGIYHDGVYTGENSLPTPQFIVVDVAIKKGRVVAIKLRKHPAWSSPQEQEKLLQTVISYQTTSTVVPRDEGSEKDHLLDAIDEALNKARQAPSSVH